MYVASLMANFIPDIDGASHLFILKHSQVKPSQVESSQSRVEHNRIGSLSNDLIGSIQSNPMNALPRQDLLPSDPSDLFACSIGCSQFLGSLLTLSFVYWGWEGETIILGTIQQAIYLRQDVSLVGALLLLLQVPARVVC